MASEARLYTFSPETKASLRKFRLTTSRASEPQARIYFIDQKSLEIRQDDEERTYTSLEDLSEDLPENSPRFILLSYPVELKSGRLAAPYVLIYYMPVNANGSLRMVYAAAKELMRNTAEVSKVLEVSEEEELLAIKEALIEG